MLVSMTIPSNLSSHKYMYMEINKHGTETVEPA